ncbi:hypothetical protein ACH41E_24180 [Streptomyces sp. NPDC020412]
MPTAPLYLETTLEAVAPGIHVIGGQGRSLAVSSSWGPGSCTDTYPDAAR